MILMIDATSANGLGLAKLDLISESHLPAFAILTLPCQQLRLRYRRNKGSGGCCVHDWPGYRKKETPRQAPQLEEMMIDPFANASAPCYVLGIPTTLVTS